MSVTTATAVAAAVNRFGDQADLTACHQSGKLLNSPQAQTNKLPDGFGGLFLSCNPVTHSPLSCGLDSGHQSPTKADLKKTRWSPRTRTQTRSKSYICPNDTLVGHSCGTLLWVTLVGNSCGTLLWVTLMGHTCRTLLWDTLVGHSYGTLLWNTLVGHSCRTLLWDMRDTLVGHCCGTLIYTGHSCGTLL